MASKVIGNVDHFFLMKIREKYREIDYHAVVSLGIRPLDVKGMKRTTVENFRPVMLVRLVKASYYKNKSANWTLVQISTNISISFY